MTTSNRRIVLLTGGLALAHGSLTPARGVTSRQAARGEPARGAARPSPSNAPQSGAMHPGGAGAVRAPVLSSFPSTDPQVVADVVGAAHTDLPRVAELVTARPHLAKAAVDWGFGDWESALGAAAHMGRRDIADFLLAHGARPNIFSAAMMGQLAVVRAMVEASPGVQRIPGPHGITLLAHARAGGEAAAAVHEYLEGLGDADLRPESVELTEEQLQPLLGTYGFEASDNATLEVESLSGVLALRRAGQEFGRRVLPVSATEFYPSGSPTVRVVFEMADGPATSFRVIDSEVTLIARRIDG
jgi:hypothetical protein